MTAFPSSTATVVGMPLDEFIRLYEQEGAFELVNGERISVLPGVAEHSELVKLFYDLLMSFARQQPNIAVYVETPYVLTYSPDWVTGARTPDVMVYSTARLNAYKTETANWRRMPFVLVPDLCVEVISTHDVYSEVDAKIERYLADGVRLVWVVNPRTSSVRVHSANSLQSVRLTEAYTLDGGEVLPGFTLPVRDIFTV